MRFTKPRLTVPLVGNWWAKRLLDTLADEYGSSLDDLAVWADLCHTIYNRKEFIYVF